MSREPDVEDPKIALVTGGARRIGAEIVHRLHAEGMSIALHYNTSGRAARALCDELDASRPGSAKRFQADLRDAGAADALIASVEKTFGRLDALVNNASSFFATPLGAIDEAALDELLGTNLKAPLFVAQAAAPALRASAGCIVNVSDIYASKALADHAAYCAAKAGLDMLTRVLALDLAPHVRVNAIAPGAILWPESGASETHRAAVLAGVPMGRAGEPRDIAETVLFLIRDADYVTGQVIRVDGGRAIG